MPLLAADNIDPRLGLLGGALLLILLILTMVIGLLLARSIHRFLEHRARRRQTEAAATDPWLESARRLFERRSGDDDDTVDLDPRPPGGLR